MRKNQKKIKKIALIICIPVILAIGYFIFSIFQYQQLVNEGSVLADNQCLRVNPIIINRKNIYIKSLQALKDNNYDEYLKQTETYFKISDDYVSEQTKWLDAQKKYMSKWDFQYFNPPYIQTAAQYQYASRKADMDSTKLLMDSYNIAQLNKSLSEELAFKSMEKIKIRDDADKKYNDIWDNPGKLDWRTRFIKVPASKCPDENFNIPDVEDFLNPKSIPSNIGQPVS